jgi:cob(I)alamin adenosyltransferase
VSKIYTKSGDDGTTDLFGGTRVSKADIRVEAYGTIDEANTFIGAAMTQIEDDALSLLLEFVMHKLFNCSSALAHPPDVTSQSTIRKEDLATLEQAIDSFMNAAGPITEFVLPTGTPAASSLHVARTVCRRAERRLVALNQLEPVNPLILKFINRISDFLFAASRYANKIGNKSDLPWNSKR